MGTIVIHAGMPKAGSSSVQTWLAANADALWRERSIYLAVSSSDDPARLMRYTGKGSVNSSALAVAMGRGSGSRPPLFQRFVDTLARLADGHPLVLLSSESFANLLWRPVPEFVDSLSRLARQHSVRIAYYVRPQHTALEAAWRQWGFRISAPPSEYLRNRAQTLDYLSTYHQLRDMASLADFTPRPFRSDLLDEGDVVADFTQRFLGVPVTQGMHAKVNVGSPLELVILLRSAPRGLLGVDPHDNRVYRKVKALLAGIDAPVSEEVQRGRRVLQRWCHRQFEGANRQLIDELAWPTRTFVPGIDGTAEDLDAIDELWRSHASPMELAAFVHLLRLQLRNP